MKFGVDVVDHLAQERLTVAVDFLNGQRCDGQTKLTEDDLLGHVFDLGDRQTEKTLGCVLHDGGLGVNTDGKGRRHVDADVLHREGVLKVDVDGHRFEVEEAVVLNQRPDDFSATVVTLCGAGALRVTVHNQDLVGGCEFVSSGSEVDRSEQDEDEQAQADCNDST